MNNPQRDNEMLSSLLSDEEQAAGSDQAVVPSNPDAEDDVDALIDGLEALVAEGRRMPFRKLLVDEDRLLSIVDRLRTAVPAEVRQAHHVLDLQDEILDKARAEAQRIVDERGLMERVEGERQRLLEDSEREAERIRSEADRYVRRVLEDLSDRLAKAQTSVRNGIETLQSGEAGAPKADV